MVFGNKYDIASMKKLFDKAENNFNLTKTKATDKEPAPQTFRTKFWFKMYAMAFKSAKKIEKNPKMSMYYKQIISTKGDYSRREKGVGEQVQAAYEYFTRLIKDNPDLKYTMCGVFCDTVNNLKDLKWRGAYKIAFDYDDKTAGAKSLAGSFKLMYWSLAFGAERLMLKLLGLEYEIASGKNPVDAVLQIEYNDQTLMDKMVIPLINLNALTRSVKDPAKMIRTYISAEKSAEKSTESFSEMEARTPLTSEEAAVFKAIGKAAGNIWLLVAEGASGVAASIAAMSGVVAAPIGIAVIGVISIIFICTLIPTIRLIIYYSYSCEVDMVKELELNRELLENNIAILQEKYDNMSDGDEKTKLGEVIAKQKEMYLALEKKIANYTGDNYAVENDLDADESEADNEATDNSTTYNGDGDPTNDNDGYSIEI